MFPRATSRQSDTDDIRQMITPALPRIEALKKRRSISIVAPSRENAAEQSFSQKGLSVFLYKAIAAMTE